MTGMTKHHDRKARIEVTEVVKTVDLSPIPMGDNGDDVHLRVEILRRGGRKTRFTARVWRIEFYRIQPTFPQKDGHPSAEAADEQVLTVDENFAQGVFGPSAGVVLKKVIAELKHRFFGARRRA